MAPFGHGPPPAVPHHRAASTHTVCTSVTCRPPGEPADPQASLPHRHTCRTPHTGVKEKLASLQKEFKFDRCHEQIERTRMGTEIVCPTHHLTCLHTALPQYTSHISMSNNMHNYAQWQSTLLQVRTGLHVHIVVHMPQQALYHGFGPSWNRDAQPGLPR